MACRSGLSIDALTRANAALQIGSSALEVCAGPRNQRVCATHVALGIDNGGQIKRRRRQVVDQRGAIRATTNEGQDLGSFVEVLVLRMHVEISHAKRVPRVEQDSGDRRLIRVVGHPRRLSGGSCSRQVPIGIPVECWAVKVLAV
jgi:hypothetical protein